MLLTLSTTHRPATDLGYLLHKNPARAQSLPLSVGTAHVIYPQAEDERCSAALLLEVDPIRLAGRGRSGGGDLGRYVNDRPYAGSSLLAFALGKVFSSARRGVSKERPELVDRTLPLELRLPSMSCHGGTSLAERFFGPLGWQVDATPIPLDDTPEWGASSYVDLRLTGELRLADAINHLYVGLPVLDDAKHYWVGTDEVDKLIRAGAGWLATHPERELITSRYLAHQTSLVRAAEVRTVEEPSMSRLADDTGVPDPDAVPVRDVPLAVRRRDAVLAELRSSGAHRVIDLGCGSGALLPMLLAEPAFTHIVAADVSHRSLQDAARRLRLDTMPDRQQARLTLLQTSLTYTDHRLTGYDAAILMEVIEHLDPDRLPALEHAVFGYAAPGTVIVTTPNREHNIRYNGLAPGAMRHPDHRFEWTRSEFADWAGSVGERYGYAVQLGGVGESDPEVGAPTQLAVFHRTGPAGAASGGAT